MKKSICLLLFAFFIHFQSSACECIFIAENLQEKAKKYDYIFFAEVESLVDNQFEGFERTIYFKYDSTYHKKGGYHPKLRVLEVFKGKVKKKMTGEYLLMENDWSNCAEFFRPGELILIFGNTEQKGGVATSSCASNWTFESLEDFHVKKKEIRKATRRKFLGISLG